MFNFAVDFTSYMFCLFLLLATKWAWSVLFLKCLNFQLHANLNKDDQNKKLKQWKDISQKISYTKTHKKKGPLGDILNLQIGIILVNKYPSPVFFYNKAAVQKENRKTGYFCFNHTFPQEFHVD